MKKANLPRKMRLALAGCALLTLGAGPVLSKPVTDADIVNDAKTTGDLDQHFLTRHRELRLLRMLQRHPERIGLGIDEGTALVFHGDKQFVLGKSLVMRCQDRTCIRVDPLNPN